MTHPVVASVTERIVERSRQSRSEYLALIDAAKPQGPARRNHACSNAAHAAAASEDDKPAFLAASGPNLAIVTSYNDMLSTHQPYGAYPPLIKIAAREIGATAQVAGGVPAMCDGVTQGQHGMQMSLFSRDTIAMSTAVALSHDVFDGVLLLGICDKIVPGLLIGALRFGHLPCVFVPGGPMPSGMPNKEKTKVRERFAAGQATQAELLEAEAKSFHAPGTCTFYGTANSNQMLMEAMGLHVPGAAFVPPNTPLRQALTRAAVHAAASSTALGDSYRPLGRAVNEKAMVNAIVALLASGGSTNHAIHIPAIARAAGIKVNWDDFADLSAITPLLARIYPNGSADVNDFQAAGGTGFFIRELIDAGLLHADLQTVAGADLHAYTRTPILQDNSLTWIDAPERSEDETVLRNLDAAFDPEGGMKVVQGNLGRGMFKTSAVVPDLWTVEAPARVFDSQEDALAAFKTGELDRDCVIVVRFQGPRANGMPELHKLTPPMGVLLNRGFRVALVTDGRMSGASGKAPCAIHVHPEAVAGGPLAKVRDGDIIRVDANSGMLAVLAPATEWDNRIADAPSPNAAGPGTGRELFGIFREFADNAESGGSAMLSRAGL
ncbi:MAG: phosphogluconate dehydratase [Caulobacterales bacterium]